MDSSSATFDALSSLSDKDKRELQQFVANETQKARIQQAVHNMTDMCWKKCSGGEEKCIKNCVGRFMDGSETIIKELGKFRGGMGN